MRRQPTNVIGLPFYRREFIGALIAGGAAIVGGILAKKSGDDAADDARRNAEFARKQAKESAAFYLALGERNAEAALAEAKAQAELVKHDRQRRLGQAKAIFGASGARVSGSAVDVMMDAARTFGQEVALVRWGGREAAKKARLSAAAAARDALLRGEGVALSSEAQASQFQRAGNAALVGGLLSGTGKVLGAFEDSSEADQ